MAFTFPDHLSNSRFKATTTTTISLMTHPALQFEAWALTEGQPERHPSLSLTQVVSERERCPLPLTAPAKLI